MYEETTVSAWFRFAIGGRMDELAVGRVEGLSGVYMGLRGCGATLTVSGARVLPSNPGVLRLYTSAKHGGYH